MLTYIPDYLRPSLVAQSGLGAAGAEIDALNISADEVLAQLFALTATEIGGGLDRWEAFLGLSNYSGIATDVQRRERIIAKIRGAGTTTVALVKNVAESYANGTVEVVEDNPAYTFLIRFISQHGIPARIDDLKAAIREIKPAHLAVLYEYKYLIWNELDAETITWNALDTLAMSWDDFELGGWLD